jgi:hypothetical protein
VRQAARVIAFEDEPIQREVAADASEPIANVSGEILTPEEDLPSADPVFARRRTVQPRRIPIRDGERGEENRKRVADQSGIKVREVAGTR